MKYQSLKMKLLNVILILQPNKKVKKMKKYTQNIKKFRDSNNGAVGIVVTILLIGLFITVMTIVQTVYVPMWMAQKEAEHMEDIAQQFSMLKYAIDTQLINENDIPISTSIKLGSKEMPFLPSSRSFGSLDVLSDEFILTIGSEMDTYSDFSVGIIKYSSRNAYFLDQSYIFEGGAVIMDQNMGNVMAILPSFSVYLNPETNDINISFNVVNVSSIEDKISVSGYGIYPIKTEFSSTMQPDLITNVNNLTITTKYTNAWEIFFNRTLSQTYDFEYGTHYLISENSDGLKIEFLDDYDGFVKKPNLFITIYNINAQVGPGWI